MYIKRHAEATIQALAKQFGAVLVTGPRQVGKTTMLQYILDDMNYVTMDDAILRAAAVESTTSLLSGSSVSTSRSPSGSSISRKPSSTF